MNRSSIYLVDRASALLQTVKFFRGASRGMNQNDKHLIFLAQLDFWDFEMDSLIYLFQTFDERQRDWGDAGATTIESKIMKHNLLLKRKYVRDFAFNQTNKYGHWNPYRFTKQVVAPHDLLQDVIKEWNTLMDDCNYLLINDKDAKSAELAGCKIQRNLNSYKKNYET